MERGHPARSLSIYRAIPPPQADLLSRIKKKWEGRGGGSQDDEGGSGETKTTSGSTGTRLNDRILWSSRRRPLIIFFHCLRTSEAKAATPLSL
jgi:hypothetical protein